MLKRNGLAINQDDSVICVPQQQQDTNDLAGIAMSDSQEYVDVSTAFLSTKSIQDEVYRLSEVRLSCLQNSSQLLKALFQGGQKNPFNLYVCFPWHVFMDDDNKYNHFLPYFGWHNSFTNQFGFDPISLCSAIKNVSDKRALDVLVDHLSITRNTYKNGERWKWVQEKNPITLPFPWFLKPSLFNSNYLLNPKCLLKPYYLLNPHFLLDENNFKPNNLVTPIYLNHKMFKVYYSSSGQQIGYVAANKGEVVREYFTLWRRSHKRIVHWLPICPEKPYMLYNLDKITNIPDVPVVFMADEWQAAQHQEGNLRYRFVFTTCPMGLIYLPDADLSALKGRDVVICLTPSSHDEIQILPKFIDKATKEGIKKIHITFDDYKTHVTAEAFLKEPYKYGYVGRIDESQSTGCDSVIIKPGEKIPSADKNRDVLLHPEIIEEGYIAWLYASSKVGKTLMALSIAYAVAKGNCELGVWFTKQPKKVIYVLGEGKPDKIQKNINMIMAGQGDTGEIPFEIIMAKNGTSHSFNILDASWQKRHEKELKSCDLIIFDNLQCLTNNAVEEFPHVREYLNELIKHAAVLVIDHENRKHDLQGSVSKERFVDLSIRLTSTDQKNTIEVSYPDARYIDGDPFLLQMVFNGASFKFEPVIQDDTPKPSAVPEEITNLARMRFLRIEMGLSVRACAEETGLSKSRFDKSLDTLINKLQGEDRVLFDAECERLKKTFPKEQDTDRRLWENEFRGMKK